MNQSTKDLQNLLEQATSPGPVKLDELSPEARELREAWNGWSEMLSRADASWDERRVLEAVAVSASPRQVRSHWFSAALALSLTLLVGLALGQLDFLTREFAVGDAIRVARAIPRRPETPTQVPTVTPTDTPANDDGNSLLTWDDSFDKQLAAARETLTSIHASWHSSGNSQAWLEQRISDLRSDMEDGSL